MFSITQSIHNAFLFIRLGEQFCQINQPQTTLKLKEAIRQQTATSQLTCMESPSISATTVDHSVCGCPYLIFINLIYIKLIFLCGSKKQIGKISFVMNHRKVEAFELT